MDHSQESESKTINYVTSGALWLLTSVLGGVVFFAGRRVILSTYSRFFPSYVQDTSQNPFSLLNILVSFPLAFLAIAIIIGGFEYHLGSSERLGSQKSWQIFARTLAIEAGFLLLAAFI